MIIKAADDKRPQIATLQGLLSHPGANATTRKRIEQELRNIQAGNRGEEEAAYEMQVHFGGSANWLIIHDLRVEHGGLVAQIDHLLINRFLEIWVCESKHFSEGVAINEHGEFAAFFGSKPYGVPSPIEQNNRHILILRRAFDSGAVSLPTRLGFTIKPELKSLVLVSSRARISRPKAKIAGLDAIIKSDMLVKTIERSGEDANPLTLAKLVGKDTLENLARAIAKMHKPIEFDWHAKFGLTPQSQPLAPVPTLRPMPTKVPSPGKPVNTASEPQVMESAEEPRVKQKLICHSCGESVPYNVARFCWFNKSKFGGNVYCIDCQKKVANS